MVRETSALLSIGGAVGTYTIPNPYGGAIAELVIHNLTGSGAASSAMLDIDGSLSPAPAALPTLNGPFRGVVYTSIGGGNAFGPAVTEAETFVKLIVFAGSVWLTYQWQRIVPDAGADAIRHTLAATVELIDAARTQCSSPKCGCATHRAIDRAMGDARLSDRT